MSIIVFSSFAVKVKKRSLIVTNAYLALGLVAIFGLALRGQNVSSILIFQAIQFAVFTYATISFSIENKRQGV